MGRTPRDLAEALEALSQRPTPALVWRSGAERVELSGRVLVNWVEKSAGLLAEELDVASGNRVSVSPVPHWRLVVIALAALRVGARVQFTHHPDGKTAVHAHLETHPDHDAAAQVLLTVADPALAFSCAAPVPPGAVDFADEVRGMSDVYSEFENPDPAGTALDSGVTHGELVTQALDAAPAEAGSTVHLPLTEGWGDTHLLQLLGIVLSGGAVLVTARPEDVTADVLAQEHATTV